MSRLRGVPGLVVGLIVLVLAIAIGVWLTSGSPNTGAVGEPGAAQDAQEEQQDLQENRREDAHDASGEQIERQQEAREERQKLQEERREEAREREEERLEDSAGSSGRGWAARQPPARPPTGRPNGRCGRPSTWSWSSRRWRFSPWRSAA